MSARLRRIAAAIAVVLVASGLTVAGSSPASAVSNLTLCSTYEGCAALGMTAHGYESRTASYWKMTPGHNCTNYAAFLMVRAGMSRTRPWVGNGNANGWGHYDNPRDTTPAVGSIAWWDANKNGAGATGHVAYVEAVLAPDLIVVSEDNFGGEFYWRAIRASDPGWPTGFIHFADSNGPNNVPELSAVATTPSVYADSTLTRPLDPNYLKPGSTAWVVMGVQNLGSVSWSGLQLATTDPVDHASVLADNWISPSRAATQKQATVGIGQTATFGFSVRIPADAVTGTVFAERFIPAASGGILPSGAGTLTLRADTRDLFARTVVPQVSGAPQQGQTLVVDPGVWTPAVEAMSYQWLRAGVPIPGAIGPSYLISEADVGTSLSVDVTGSRTGYVPVTQTVQTSLVRSAFSNTLPLRHSLRVGEQIVSSNGQFRAVQTTSGKFVVVNRFSKKVAFSTGRKGSVRTYLRKDGLLISYNRAGKPVWNSGTKGKKVTRAVITNSGKLVLYSSSGKLVWNSAKQKKR